MPSPFKTARALSTCLLTEIARMGLRATLRKYLEQTASPIPGNDSARPLGGPQTARSNAPRQP